MHRFSECAAFRRGKRQGEALNPLHSSGRHAVGQRLGFTLVELLVVIAIIGVLIALLLPAVQSARESGRRAQCSNNLKQLSLGCLIHLETHGIYPSGGWGPGTLGDPDCGVGRSQPGAWAFSILPFVEAQNVYALGSMSGEDLPPGPMLAAKKRANRERLETPVPGFNCPSRRPNQMFALGCCVGNAFTPKGQVRTCYAANAGDVASPVPGETLCQPGDGGPTPPVSPTGDCWQPTASGSVPGIAFDWGRRLHCINFNGVSFQGSEIDTADITDGTTQTYLLGEKHVDSDQYLNGLDWGDDWSMYTGMQDDMYRVTYHNLDPNAGPVRSATPVQDTPGAMHSHRHRTSFGSAHPAGCNMSYCDGSVRLIGYDIDPEIHRRLGNRNDGLLTDQ